MSFASLVAQLKLDISDFSAKMSSASRSMRSFASYTNNTYGKATASLKSHNLQLKDTARIVQGIVVAQGFYQIAGAIRDATGALVSFNESLDYAKVTYSALFGNANIATDFLDVLKEHSIETIFEYDTLTEATKKLAAYGIEYKNLMFIMNGLTNLGAMSGDTAAIDRISYALGQIYAKGKLSAEEMRQLANAYVPIQEIIKEKFNLTGDDLKKVGDLNLPAGEVINAIVDYANEEFGAVGDAAMFTITGLKNRIVDTLKVLGVEALQPVSVAFKSFLTFVADGLTSLRETFSHSGIGGVFEQLVPDPDLQVIIRQFVANLKNAFMTIASIVTLAGKVIGNMAVVFVSSFNVIAPVITVAINTLAGFLNALLETRTGTVLLRTAILATAAAFTIMRVQAIGALIITALSKAIMTLSKTLLLLSAIIVKHPIIAFISLVTVALIGIASASDKASAALSRFFGLFSGSTGGDTYADVFQKTEKEINSNVDVAEQFNHRLEEGAGAAGDLADNLNSAGKAAKKTSKNLLSFDEVFRLNENDAGSSIGGLTDGIDDILSDLGDLNAGLTDALKLEIPDFSEYTDKFTDGLFNGLQNSIIGKVAFAGLGAIIMKKLMNAIVKASGGAIVSSKAVGVAKAISVALMGAFIGYGFDAIASIFTEKLWQAIEEKFSLGADTSDDAKFSATIGSVIGGAIGGILGGPGGAIIGAAAGHLGAGVASMIWSAIQDKLGAHDTQGVSTAIGTGLNAAIAFVPAALKGGLTAGLKGGILGAIGGLVGGLLANALSAWIAKELNMTNEDLKNSSWGQTLGSTLGAIVGFALGGPIGSAIGGAAGSIIGSLGGLFFDPLTEAFGSPTSWGLVGASAGAAIGTVVAPGIGTAIGAAIGGLAGVIGGSIKDLIEAVDGDWSVLGDALKLWGEDILDAFLSPFKNAWETIKMVWDDYVMQPFRDIANSEDASWLEIGGNIIEGIFKGMLGVLTSVGAVVLAVFEAIIGSFLAIFGIHSPAETTKPIGKNILLGVLEGIVGAVGEVLVGIGEVGLRIIQAIGDWFAKIGEDIGSWASDAFEDVSNFVSDAGEKIGTWVEDTKQKFTDFKDSASEKISTFVEKAKTKFSDWKSDITSKAGSAMSDFKSKISSGMSSALADIGNFISKSLSKIKDWAKDFGKDIGDAVKNAGEGIGDFASNVGSKIKGGVTKAYNKITGHATGGVFNREHVARFAEGNKSEAIIPLENRSAMQPFVDAVAGGLAQTLGPMLANINNSNSEPLQPLYVGTLIADERGLKELNRKMQVIQIKEEKRRS